MKKHLDTAANIVFIAVVLLLAFVLVKNHLLYSSSSFVREGDILRPLPLYDWISHGRTLVLAIKKGCRYCEDSVPFYQRLAQLSKQRDALSVHLLVISPDDATAVADLLRSKKLEIDSRAGVVLADFNIAATPTLLLVGPNGRVLKLWRGQLSHSEEEHVIEMISPGTLGELRAQ